MVTPAPNPIDTLDFQFKLKCRLKVFNTDSDNSFQNACSLLATASRYGLVFVGTLTNSFLVIQIEEIENKQKDVDTFARRTIDLPSKPTHISINCDSTKLCVVVEQDGCPTAIIFEVLSFLKQELNIIKEIRLSPSPGVTVIELDWNPAIPDIMTVCKSDGSLCLYEFKGNALDINELPLSSKSNCFCWSPKGKQIAVGSLDGKITQYKPDLKAVKVINPPPLQGNPSIISLKWVSSFQFIGIYYENKPDSDSCLIVIDAPKTGNISYTNYDDVCYSYGNIRPQQFYMFLQTNWNVLMVASSNSMEVGVLGTDSDKWIQWILSDESRAELPLSQTKQNSLPIGMAFNVSTTQKLDNEAEFPAPMLLLLSHYGQLCCFYNTYVKSGAPSIYTPMDPIADKSGLSFYQEVKSQKVINNIPQVQNEVKKEQTINQPARNTSSSLPKLQLFQPTATAGQLAGFSNSSPQLSTMFGKTQPINTQTQPTINPPNSQNNPGIVSPFFSKQSTPNLFTTQEPPKQAATVPLQGPPESTNITKEPAKVVDNTLNKTVTETPKKEVVNRLPVNTETENLIADLVREECFALEAEIKALLHKGKNLRVDIGTDSESNHIANKATSLEEFLKAVKETSATQASEIHTLKQTIIQTWAWYEEARSRFTSLSDPMLVALLKCQPLDPASQRQLEDINHLIYYLDSQLTQANQHLDEQWDNFQDSLSKNIKIRIPTIDAIYGTMAKQRKTLQQQKYVLKEISNRIVSQKRNDSGIVFMSLDKTPVQYAKLIETQKKLTDNKAQKLHRFFSQKNVTQISISKPQMGNSTIHLTSLLAAPLSPIVAEKKKISIKHDFIMSTPKPCVPKTLYKEKSDVGSMPNQEFTVKLINKNTPDTMSSINVSTTGPMKFNTGNAANTSSTTKVQPSFQFSSTFTNQNTPSTVPSPFPNLSIPSSKSPFVTVTSTSEKREVVNDTKNVLSNPIKTQNPNFIPSTNIAPTNSQFSFKLPEATSVTEIKIPTPGSASNTSIFSNTSTTGKFNFVKTAPVTAPSSLVSSAPGFNSGSSKGLTISPVPSVSTPTNIQPFSFPLTNISKSPTISIDNKSITSTSPATPALSTTSSNISLGKDENVPVSVLEVNAVSSTTKTEKPPTANQSFPFGTATSITSSDSSNLQISKSETVAAPNTVSTTSIFGNTQAFANPPTSLSIKTSSATTTQSNTSFFSNQQTTTTAASIFGKNTGSIFGGVSSTSSSGSIFGKSGAVATPPPPAASTTSSIFGALASTLPTTKPQLESTTTTATTSIFGSATTTTTTTASIFKTSTNSTSSTPVTPTTTTTSIFGAVTTSNTFGTSTASPIVTAPTSVFGANTISTSGTFGVSTTTTSVFGGSTTSTGTSSTTPSAFAPSSTAGIFGTATSSAFGASTTTTGSIFGAATSSAFGTSTTMAGSVFGAVTSTTFGGTPFAKPTEATTSASVFGTPTTTTSSIFGTANSNPVSSFEASGSTAGSVFGTSSSPPTGSIFGAPSNTTSPFGTPATTTTSIFAAPAATTGSIFGTPSTSATVFGAPSTSATTGSIFGNTGNVFGKSASIFSNNTSSTPFGSTTTAASVFGNANPSPFASAVTSSSPFGTTTVSTASPFASIASSAPFGTTSNSSPFGQTTQQSSFGIFGTGGGANNFSFNNLNVGSSTSTNSAFGSGFAQQAQNPFSKPAEQKSPFSSNSIFGSPAATTSNSNFASGNSIFSKPANAAFGSAPVFGSSSPFGAQSPAFGSTNTFGGGFSSPNQGSFSSPGQSVQQTGFSSPSFQKPSSGFGSPPVFGSASPGFGNPPSFGANASFGSGSTFGSPQKVFGGGSEPSFGGMAQNSTFGNLANQNTVGFGNLAQQANTPNQSTSFSGGSSFSSWR